MNSSIKLLPKYLWYSSTLKELNRDIRYNALGHDLCKKGKMELLAAEWYSKILSKSNMDEKKKAICSCTCCLSSYLRYTGIFFLFLKMVLTLTDGTCAWPASFLASEASSCTDHIPVWEECYQIAVEFLIDL